MHLNDIIDDKDKIIDLLVEFIYCECEYNKEFSIGNDEYSKRAIREHFEDKIKEVIK